MHSGTQEQALQESCFTAEQGPFRPLGRNRGLPLRRRPGKGPHLAKRWELRGFSLIAAAPLIAERRLLRVQASVVENPPASAGDTGSTPGLREKPRGSHLLAR